MNHSQAYSQLLLLVDLLQILFLTAASVVELDWFWAAAAAALLQLLLQWLRAGCAEASGYAAVTAAAVHSGDAAAEPACCHQVVQSLDVAQSGSDLLTAVAHYGSEVSAAAVAVL